MRRKKLTVPIYEMSSSPLAAAADMIVFLRDQVEVLSRDLHNAEIRARFAEDSFDEHLAEISRLRTEVDNRDASQKTPFKTSRRIDALSSMNAQLVEQLRATELKLQVAQENCLVSPALVSRIASDRETLRKSEFKAELKARQKSSRKTVTKKDALEEQFNYPE